MSTIRNPVGPQPSSVYWRRRLIVGLGLVAVIVIVLLIVFRPGGDTPAPTPSSSGEPAPTSSETPSASPTTDQSAAPGEAGACAPSDIEVAAVVDATTFANGEEPMLSMEITNTGSVPCSYDVGTGAQEYIITSGQDRIWSSADCVQDPTQSVMELEPGVTLATTPFAWNRTRSTPESCQGPEVIAGGASYHLTVKLGEVQSEKTFQFILN